MVLLNHIIEVPARSYFHCPPAAIFLAEQSQAAVSRLIPIDVDFLRPRDAFLSDGCTEECLRRFHAAIMAEQ
jgi:hypothetical protein